MDICLSEIIVENFKSYDALRRIDIADLSVFMGANSSGKSTALQTLLAIKQTIECNSPDIDLLLSGKYVTLGDFNDVINKPEKESFRLGVSVTGKNRREDYGTENKNTVMWTFVKDIDGHIRLKSMDMNVEGENVSLVLEHGSFYRIFVNDVNTQLSVEMRNLLVKRFAVSYDQVFNETFQKFVNGLLKIVSREKKFSGIEKTKMVSINGLKELYHGMLNDVRKMDISGSGSILDAEDVERISERVMNLIDSYCRYQFPYFESYTPLPKGVQKSLWRLCVLQHSRAEKIEVLCEQYENILLEYEKEHDLSGENIRRDILPRNTIYTLHDSQKGTASGLNIISEAFMNYRECVREILAKIYYLGPIREKPQGLYNVGFETIPKYVGPTGEFFASVLLHENKSKEFILPNHVCETMSLLEALDEWAVHLNIASEVKVEQSNSFGFSVSVANTQQRKSDIMNVGIGTSQVLPVLITGLLSEVGELLIFEQPELHLHPFSQSRLADFFVTLVKHGRKIIVETHSEYLILRLRYHILTENIDEKQLVINFFQNKNGTQVYKGILSGYGNLQYPSDFCDETQELINDLMNASLMKKRNEDSEKCVN